MSGKIRATTYDTEVYNTAYYIIEMALLLFSSVSSNHNPAVKYGYCYGLALSVLPVTRNLLFARVELTYVFT
jgi:hypothetical protein